MSGAYLGLKSRGRILFYTSIALIFKYLQANVRIRDLFRLILHPGEESYLFSLRIETLRPNRHTTQMVISVH